MGELLRDGLQFLATISRSRAALAAEILFLRKQLAYYEDHRIRPRPLRDASRLCLLFWSRLFEERIADELSLKLGIYVSPRTIRKYWPQLPGMGSGRRRTPSPAWKTFVRNHAQGIVACDFLVVVTARFRILFVFVALEIGSRRILHCNVTAHPTAEWTLQQLRDAIPSDHPYQFLIHDRDTIFSSEWDAQVKSTFGLRVWRTPVRAPHANAYCERLMGTVRRACLDFMIPLHERQLRGTLRSWVTHYNKGRPHSSLGPGTPEPTPTRRLSELHPRHRLPRDCRITVQDILGGLHHEYQLEKCVA